MLATSVVFPQLARFGRRAVARFTGTRRLSHLRTTRNFVSGAVMRYILYECRPLIQMFTPK